MNMQVMRKLQKSFTIMLCLVMFCSMLPVSSMAEEPEVEETETVHEHDYETVVTDPTCTEQGYTTYTCACGESYIDNYTDSLNHPETVVLKGFDADCTNAGLTDGLQCALCGEILQVQEEIPALGHQPVHVDAVPATETSSGTAAGTVCSLCGEVLEVLEEIPMTTAAAELAAGEIESTGETKNTSRDITAPDSYQDDNAPDSIKKATAYEIQADRMTTTARQSQLGAPSGINGNGTWGLTIDINASPYTDYANKTDSAYSKEGCAWFAAARVFQLTGQDVVISSGYSWYNDGRYGWYGFIEGEEFPKGIALACYLDHVRVIEEVRGDQVLVSEGGYYGSGTTSDNGFCCIRETTREEICKNGLYGFVYLSLDSAPGTYEAPLISTSVNGSAVNISWTDVGANSYRVYVEKADDPSVVPFSENNGKWFSTGLELSEARWRVHVSAYFTDTLYRSSSAEFVIPSDEEPSTIVASGTWGSNLSWTLDENGKLIISGVGEMEDFPVNSTSAWRSKSSDITSISIGAGVTSIGKNAFYLCDSLTGITIPENVKTIGDGAFKACSKLQTVTVPNTVESIGVGVFGGCYKLTSAGPIGSTSCIQFGWTTEIPANAFYDCGELSTVTIPDTVTSIGACAFYRCSCLSGVTLPQGLKSIGELTFFQCGSLKNVRIPQGVTDVGTEAFRGCAGVESITIPSSLTSIGSGVFRDCVKLTGVEIPSGVISIGDSAFTSCSLLKDILIPGSVESIGEYAFSCCGMTGITIPESVTNIGAYAFSNCQKLQDLTIPSNVTRIEEGLFEYSEALTSVTLPQGVTSIGDYAFRYCRSLRTIAIPDSVESIGRAAFFDCRVLNGITIPERVTTIGNQAFGECAALSEVTIRGNMPGIGESAFEYVTATIFYPGNNRTYTAGAMTDYGGTLNWTPVGTDVPVPQPALPMARYQDENGNTILAETRLTFDKNGEICFVETVGDNEYYKILAPEIPGYTVREIRITDGQGYTFTTTVTSTWGFKIFGWDDKYGEWDIGWGGPASTLHAWERSSAKGELICTYIYERAHTVAVEFSDVKDSSNYFYDPVYWAVENGITTGRSDTTFDPYGECTRGHIVTFLWRAFGKPEPTVTSNPFGDVKTTDSFYKAVLWAYEKGITTGQTATTFGPWKTCTRGQIVTFLWRAMGQTEPSIDNPFTDVKNTDGFYKAVLWAVQNGITTGKTQTTFEPWTTCTRGQAVTFLYRAMN